MATFCLFMPSKNMGETSAPDPVSQWQIRWETTQSSEEHESPGVVVQEIRTEPYFLLRLKMTT